MEIVRAKVLLELIRSDELPSEATDALVAGFDSPSLRELAGLTREEALYEAFVLFERAIAELDLREMTIKEAVMCLSRETSKEILDGSIGAYEGARYIWDLSLNIKSEDNDHDHELDTFIYAASEWDAPYSDCELLRTGIIEQAKVLVFGSGSHK